jgi:hypothetical protein
MQTETAARMIGKLKQQLKAQSSTYHAAIKDGKTLEGKTIIPQSQKNIIENRAAK